MEVTAQATGNRRQLQVVDRIQPLPSISSVSSVSSVSSSSVSSSSSSTSMPSSLLSSSSMTSTTPPDSFFSADLTPNASTSKHGMVPKADPAENSLISGESAFSFGTNSSSTSVHLQKEVIPALVVFPSPTKSMQMVCVAVYFTLGLIAFARSCRFQSSRRSGGWSYGSTANNGFGPGGGLTANEMGVGTGPSNNPLGGAAAAVGGGGGGPGAQEAIRKRTFQQLLVLFAVCRCLSIITTATTPVAPFSTSDGSHWLSFGIDELRNVLNRLSLCLFFSLVLYQVLFWVDIVNPKVSIRSRRIWNSFVFANALFYVVVFGSCIVQLVVPEWITGSKSSRSQMSAVEAFQVEFWTEILPVILIALGNLAFSAGLMYTTCKMRHRVGRVLKQAAAATPSHTSALGNPSTTLLIGGGSGGFPRRRLDEQVQAKLHRALQFTNGVMTVCGIVFVLRMVLYLQRLWTHTECSPLVSSADACILVGYLLPEAIPCALFLMLMWEVNSQKNVPKRNPSTTAALNTAANHGVSTALVNEKTPLLGHDHMDSINGLNTTFSGSKLEQYARQFPLKVKTSLASWSSSSLTPPLNSAGRAQNDGKNGGSLWSTPHQNRRSSPLSAGLHRAVVLERAKSIDFDAKDLFDEALESVSEHTSLWIPSLETVAKSATPTADSIADKQSIVSGTRQQFGDINKNTTPSNSNGSKASEFGLNRVLHAVTSPASSRSSSPTGSSPNTSHPWPTVWVSFQCFNLKLPSKTSRSFVVVHFMDVIGGTPRHDPKVEIGRTEIVAASKHSASEPCFHRMIPIEMNPCEAIRVSVYSVRNRKSLDDLTTQWLVGESIVGLKALMNPEHGVSMLNTSGGDFDEESCGMATLCELYSPLCRSSSSGEVVIRCEAEWNPTWMMSNEQRITRAFIYHMHQSEEATQEGDDSADSVEKESKADTDSVDDDGLSERKRTQKLLVEEELIESVYTWEIPYQLLQLMLADLLFKLEQLKREDEQDQPPPYSDASTATTTSTGHNEDVHDPEVDLELGKRALDNEKHQPLSTGSGALLSGNYTSNDEVVKPSLDFSGDTVEIDDSSVGTAGVTEMIIQIQGDAMVRKKRKWRSALIVMMEDYISLMEDAILKYGDAQLGGLTFKPSTMKADSSLCFLALNLHQQLMTVGNALPTRTKDVLNNQADALRYSRLVKSFIGSICSVTSSHHRRISSENALQDLTGPGDELDDYIEEELEEEIIEEVEEEEDESELAEEEDVFEDDTTIHVEPREALRRRVVSFDSAETLLSMTSDSRQLALPLEQRILAESIVKLGKQESMTTQAGGPSIGAHSVEQIGLAVDEDDVTDSGSGYKDNHDEQQVDERASPTSQTSGNIASLNQPFSQHRMYGTTTVGAFAAHVYGFKNGGVRQLREEIAKVEIQLQKESNRQSGFSELSVEALERQYHELKWHADRRLEVAFCQSMSALVTCFQQTLFVHLHDKTFDVTSANTSPRSASTTGVSTLERGLAYLEMISQIGFLFSVESLLSTYSNEAGMLGDMDAAVKELARVQIKLRPVKTPEESGFRVALTSSPIGIVVELPLVLNDPANFQDRWMHRIGGQDAYTGAVYLPIDTSEMDAAQEQQIEQRLNWILRRQLRVVPVLFSQGMNEMQTVANTVGKHALQKEINEESVVVLERYWQAFRHYQMRLQGFVCTPTTEGGVTAFSTGTSGRSLRDSCSVGSFVSPKALAQNASAYGNIKAPWVCSLEELNHLQCVMDDLKSTIRHAGREKCMAILLLSSSLARSLGGGRVTCCKSAKDRTAMSITLEEANLLVAHHGLPIDRRDEFTCLLRTHGVRRENARKNIGTAQYCFSALQNYMLPSEYKCPPGTGGGSRQFS